MKGSRAAGEDVQAPVGQPLEHLLDAARAAGLLELLVREPEDPELGALALQAVGDHPQVTVLEDVQRHALGRQRHEPQREQREVADGGAGMRLSL